MSNAEHDHCAYPRCRRVDISLIYYSLPICERCLVEHYNTLPTAEWKRRLKLPNDAPSAVIAAAAPTPFQPDPTSTTPESDALEHLIRSMSHAAP